MGREKDGTDISAGFEKYPTNRDQFLLNAVEWQASKTQDDETENLWRIHDSLYDLSTFAKVHPGGSDWIMMNKGIDITELFESSHPNIAKAASLLPKLFVREAKTPRNSQFTFKPDGFYYTFRRRAWEVLKETGTGPSKLMLFEHDAVLSSFLLFLILGTIFDQYWFPLIIIAGCIQGFLCILSHNFWHQKNNWRMHSWNLSPFSTYEWRISHAYSHHVFPNSSYDYEVTVFESMLPFLPLSKKSFVGRYVSVLYAQLLFAIGMHLQFIQRTRLLITRKLTIRPENFLYPSVLFFLTLIHYSTHHSSDLHTLNDSFHTCLWRWVVSTLACSWVFHTVGLSAAHHHTDCWHAGDLLTNRDWGVLQLAATRDRPEVDQSLLLSTCTFGRHILHHLLPTIDHSKLDPMVAILEETCKEFHIDLPRLRRSWLDMWLGQWKQVFRIKTRSDNDIPDYKTKSR